MWQAFSYSKEIMSCSTSNQKLFQVDCIVAEEKANGSDVEVYFESDGSNQGAEKNISLSFFLSVKEWVRLLVIPRSNQ